MFENLTEKFERAFKVLKGQGQITEINIAETLKAIRKVLLDADVNYKIAKKFTQDVKEKALGRNVLTTISPGQLMTKVCHEELATLMGEKQVAINYTGNPGVILMSGLQGSGKTTFSGKLANWLKTKKGRTPLLVACDVYRPAAIDQLRVLGEQLGVEVYADKEEKDPVKIAQAAISHAKQNGLNAVIVDTAGRLAVDEAMMDEIAAIKDAVQPTETLFVVDAMTGQDAVNTAAAFNQRIDFEGVVLTKLDGDTRGGAALSIRAVVDKPIKFIGVGEKMDALELFHPNRMADRILGMGDVVSLVERAQEQFDEKEARKIHKKIARNKFDLDDFYSQLQQIRKMGNVKDLMRMLPRANKGFEDTEKSARFIQVSEVIIQSMTPKERAHPDILNGSRKKRIAAGSGVSVREVNTLIRHFSETRKMLQFMSNKKNRAQVMQRFGGMNGGELSGMV